MAEFPQERPKILELAHTFENGMTDPAHVSAFADSPVSAAQIGTAIGATMTTAATRQVAQTALDAAVFADQNAVSALSALLLKIIEFARSKRKSVADILKWLHYEDSDPLLAIPGLCRAFELVKRTPGLLHLDWKGPKVGTDVNAGEGGRAKLYEVVWRENAAQDWKVAATVLPSDAQVPTSLWARGATIEISVRAVNLQGPGPVAPSISIAL